MFKKFSWGHGVVLALGLFMAFILFMVFVFSHGQQNSELISNNYYEDELVYQKVIDAKKNASELKNIPKYEGTKSGIVITFPEETVPEDRKVKFELYRTDDANLDVNKEVQIDGDNTFSIPAQVISAGSYTLKVKWVKANTPYQVDYDILWK